MTSTARRARRKSALRVVCLVGAALPLASYAIALATRDAGLDVRGWTEHERLRLGVDAFLMNAILIALFAPVAGVSISTTPDDSRALHHEDRNVYRATRIVAKICAAICAALVLSAALTFVSMHTLPGIAQMIARSHATLGVAALALGLLGAWAGLAFAHPLDAVGSTLAVALVLSFGILAAGPLIADVPRSLIEAALFASPLVTSAAAANIDLFRIELLYQLSPLASLGFGYPSWGVACALYALAALGCFSGTARAIGKHLTHRRS